MSDVADLLVQLGFGDYESRAYIALLGSVPVTGYELAKTSGIPRANIYAVLQKLEARGAVVRMETPEGTRYAPTPPARLTERLGDHYRTVLDATRTALEALAPPVAPEVIWQLTGYAALLDHARASLAAARTEVLIACGPAEVRALAAPLAATAARGVAITTLCLAGCPQECGACQGTIFRAIPVPARRWLLLVADATDLLAGGIAADSTAQAVSTRQPLLVQLVAGYIRQSLTLGALLDDLGDRLPDLLAAPTRQLVIQLAPDGLATAWPEYLTAAFLFRAESDPDEPRVT